MKEPLLIESNALLKLQQNAYSSFDAGRFNEKIGIIIAKGNVICDVVEATKESSPVFCSLDHEKAFGAHRHLNGGEAIMGWYHTHNGFCDPSHVDEHTQSVWQSFPEVLSVIVDVRHAKIFAWRIGPDGVEEIPFAITPASHIAEPLGSMRPSQNLGQVFRKQEPYVRWTLMHRKRAVVFGVGQLGALAAICLCKAGIGSLYLVDKDTIEPRNVNTQILYSPEDVGKPKTEVLAKGLNILAPWTQIRCENIEVPTGQEDDSVFEERMQRTRELISDVDVALTCFDNVRSRITVSILCHELGIPLVDAGCYGLNGQILATIWGKTPCIACLDIKNGTDISCAIAPTTVSTGLAVSSIQTQVAIDLLHRRRVPACVAVDLSVFTTRKVEIKRRQGCQICG